MVVVGVAWGFVVGFGLGLWYVYLLDLMFVGVLGFGFFFGNIFVIRNSCNVDWFWAALILVALGFGGRNDRGLLPGGSGCSEAFVVVVILFLGGVDGLA